MTPHTETTTAPTVSVVVPAHDTERTIGASLDSVVAQTFRDFDVVVVDDGSTDGTAEAAAAVSDGRIRVLRQRNAGAGAARNAGIASSRGRYVAFLDSDDLWLPTFLESMHQALEARPDAGFAYTSALGFDDATRRVSPRPVMAAAGADDEPPRDPELFLARLLRGNFVYTSTCVRRSVLEEVGGFDESLRAGIDYELWLRIAAYGHTGVRAPGILALYRADRPGSISSSRLRVIAGLVEVYRRAAETHPASEENRALALRMLHRCERDLAALEGDRSPAALARRARWLAAGTVHRILRTDARRAAPAELVRAFPHVFGAPSESG